MDPEKLKALQIDPAAKERPKRSLWLIFLSIAALTAAALYFAWPREGDDHRFFGRSKHPSGDTTPTYAAPPPSTTADSPRPDGSVLTFNGYIVNRERIEISPRFMGQVKWIGVKKGDSVTNQQVLVLLDDAEQKARLLEAEGRLANTQASLTKARLDYQRIRKLIADKIETPQAEDDARLKLESAQAALQEAQGSVNLAKTYLDWTIIRSPINGVVLEKLVDPGELVTPQSFGGLRGPSTALVAVADPKDLQVEIDLNESALAKVHLKQKCRVSPEAYLDKTYEGYVAEIAPEANRQKGTLQIKVQILNPDHFLTPELSAKVDFLSKEK